MSSVCFLNSILGVSEDYLSVTESPYFSSTTDSGDPTGRSPELVLENPDNGNGQPARFSAAQEGLVFGSNCYLSAAHFKEAPGFSL